MRLRLRRHDLPEPPDGVHADRLGIGFKLFVLGHTSKDFYRSSQIELNGDEAPRTTMFEFRSLPPGTYEVRAVLYGVSGDARAEVRQQVNVIASGAIGH